MTAPRPRSSVEDSGSGWHMRPAPPADPLRIVWDRLDATTKNYIARYHARLREANEKATEAWNKRNKRIEYLQAYCERNGYTEHNTRKKIEEDWTFNDANDDLIRWTREAERCKAALDAEVMMARMR